MVARILSADIYSHPHYGIYTPVNKKSLAFLPESKGTSHSGRPRLNALLEGQEKGKTTLASGMSQEQVWPKQRKQVHIWVCFKLLQLCFARAPGGPRTQALEKMHQAELHTTAHIGPHVTHKKGNFLDSAQDHTSSGGPGLVWSFPTKNMWGCLSQPSSDSKPPLTILNTENRLLSGAFERMDRPITKKGSVATLG